MGEISPPRFKSERFLHNNIRDKIQRYENHGIITKITLGGRKRLKCPMTTFLISNIAYSMYARFTCWL